MGWIWQGALKEVAEAVQSEVLDGGLLRDCLELGSNDLKGLVQIVKDLASQSYSTSDYNSELWLLGHYSYICSLSLHKIVAISKKDNS